MTHVDHFVEFINRPYFSQDVSYGTKFLNLNSSETIEIPNAVRTVKRSAMISQYIQFCQEEKFEPLSRTTLFKILEAGQASQRKSFQGLDNTAADGSAGFQKIEIIVDDLEKGGMNRQWCTEVKERLKSRKRYYSKANFEVHFKSLTAVNSLLYDFKLAQTDIFEWKAHIVRSVNQEAAKQDQLKTISTKPNCALVIMAGQ